MAVNRRIGTMPTFAIPPKDAVCAEVGCGNPASRMLVSTKATHLIASPACAGCADKAIVARRARLAAAGEPYRLANESAFTAPANGPETAEITREIRPLKPSSGPKAPTGQKDRSSGRKR